MYETKIKGKAMIRFDKIENKFYIDTLVEFPHNNNFLVFKKELATGFADLIPVDQKQMYIDIEKANTKSAIKNIRKQREANLKQRLDAIAFNNSPLGLYLSTLTILQAGKAKKVLEKQFRYNGVVKTRAEHCLERLKKGFKPVYLEKTKEYLLTTEETGVYTTLTKTEYDFLNFIIDINEK